LRHTAAASTRELARFFKSRVSEEHDAQDLMQELYLALLKVPDSQVIRHRKAYLFTIAGNLVHQHWQRRKVQPLLVSLDDLLGSVSQDTLTASEAAMPESAVALAERLSHFTQRLTGLSPKVQRAIVLHHRDGYTCDEIAKKLSVVTHRVKKYLVRGLSYCREVTAASALA
jgi:RNA polymerase sigma-70 factor (ECF subfamily)